MITNKKIFKNITYKQACPVIALISLLYYAPVLFLKQIQTYVDPITNVEYPKLIVTSFGSSNYGKMTPTVLSAIRIILVTIVLLALNIMSIFRFSVYFDKKANITRSGNEVLCKADF